MHSTESRCVTGLENILCRRVHASSSLEILPAGAVKGLKARPFIIWIVSDLFWSSARFLLLNIAVLISSEHSVSIYKVLLQNCVWVARFVDEWKVAVCGDSLAMESSPDAKLSIVSGINRQTETSWLLNCVWISRCQFFQIIGIWINEVLLCTYVAYCCEVTDVFYWCACEYFENALAFTSFRLHWKKCFCAS